MEEQTDQECEKMQKEKQDNELLQSSKTEEDDTDGHRKIYWFFRNTGKRIKDFAGRHKVSFIVLMILAMVSIFLLRVNFHPLAIGIRRYFGVLVIGLTILPLLWLMVRKSLWKAKVILAIFCVTLTGLVWFGGREVHNYLALYYRYNTLDITELEELPISGYERLQPLNSVYSLAHEVMNDSESPTLPNFVRKDDGYRWTMAIEPAYPLSRIFGDVKEIFSIPGTAPSPNFSRDNRVEVNFIVGENLTFSRNIETAVIKRFGLWRFFNYEPSEVTYITDDDGEWVQVVSLVRWRGIIFPRPEFGGVQIIRQTNSKLAIPMLTLTGAGEWIKPDEINNYKYLAGQNILSYDVSRYVASSFQFQNGFAAPFPGYHKGDIRIPDLPQDVNKQPFSAHFELEEEGNGNLYHYFALEPYAPDKQGLNTSLFMPADGTSKVYVYRHYERSGSLIGVSAISPKVMESKKNYDWNRNYPVEHRPFIRELGGKKRFFWLTTVVTRKEGENSHFIAGNVPDLVITDASYNTPIWVSALESDNWEEQLNDELGGVWANE